STWNWNSLYMNTDAVMSAVANRLGVSKSQLLDPTSSDQAVKLAHAETHVIQETKAYFESHGVDLESFAKRQRGETAILVKNIPAGISADELRKMFESHGDITRFLIPPNGTIAIVEFSQAPQSRSAFSALAYRKVKDSILFLEKAPKDLFTGPVKTSADATGATPKPAAGELLEGPDQVESMTLFVKNLNFDTSSARLTEVFKPLDGFLSARVKTKHDTKRGELSMGFGFAEFKSKTQAQAALAAMNGYNLDGHALVVKASKALDAADERRKEDNAKKLAAKKTKIVIKNIPFEASKSDIRKLLSPYGQLRSVRLPKKFDATTRGFAFCEFHSPREASDAISALRHTHLLGRRLVLDFAEEEPEDAEAEIEKMQKKVGSQVNKVTAARLTGSGRKKFNVAGDEGEAV
ncbi:Multiple RNA-binding domain-containing protein 1, partial [Coniosporium uncinatum]